MELTELLLYRGNFGFNWRPTGGRAGVWGREWGHWVSVLERSTPKRVQGEKPMWVTRLGRGFVCVSVCKGSAPCFPEMLMIPIWHQKANQVRPGADGFSSHFESIMTDPRVLSARITE